MKENKREGTLYRRTMDTGKAKTKREKGEKKQKG